MVLSVRGRGAPPPPQMSGRWSDPPQIAADRIPAVTAEQMRAVDWAMVEGLHIELVQMMENAGRALADISVPRLVYQRMGLRVGDVFAGGAVVEIGP